MKGPVLCDCGSPEAVLDICWRRGIGIEVQAFYHPRALGDPALVRKTANLVAGLPIIAMHGPFGDLNPGSFDPLVRETARQRIEQGYEIAAALGAKHIVYHHGRVPNTSPEESWIGNSVGFWDAFMRRIPEDINVYLENMLEGGPSVLCGLLDGVGHPNLRANLDVGHVHCNSRTSATEWVESLGERIGYVHLHDNRGERDEHLGLGEGDAPLRSICESLGQHAPGAIWAIETTGEGVLQSLDWLGRQGFL